MTKLISVFFVVFLFYLPVTAAPADSLHTQTIDTLQLSSRKFDQQKIKEFRNDPEFRYNRPQAGLSWWDRILLAIISFIGRLFGYATHTTFGQIVFYGICLAIILYLILKLLDVDVRDLFFRSSVKSKINFSAVEDNIHALDFESLINKAVEKKQFRDAVRLVFLFSLKKLSDADLIQWMPGKTNDEYLAELHAHPARYPLLELRYYFDYAWYGRFEVSDETFAGVRQTFNEFNETLS